jgi:hypothetical protein
MSMIRYATATTQGPVYYNTWGPHIESEWESKLADVAPKSETENLYISRIGAERRAYDLSMFAKRDEMVVVVAVDHRESDLDSVFYAVTMPTPIDDWASDHSHPDPNRPTPNCPTCMDEAVADV